MADERHLKNLEQELLEKGMLMEAGWVSFRLAVGWASAPKEQLEECRNAFFAGAQHAFSSIMNVMTDDKEPTEEDYRRMQMIDDELFEFLEAFCVKHGLPTPRR